MGARTNLSVPGYLDIAYTYDSRGRLAGILGNGKTTAFAYDAAGQRTNAVWPNGTTASYAYDAAGQLLSLDHRTPSGAPVATFAYAYDLSGNRTAMTTLEGPHAFTYDAQNQLLSAAYPDGSSETFFYDPVGNRTSLVAVASGGLSTNTTTYTYGSGNRLLADASATTTNTYAYDGAGRLTNHVVNGLPRTIAYDFQGRMTTLTDTNGSVFRYTFDAEGNRRSQSLNDCLETRFIYDGPDVLLELDPSNAVTYAWLDGPGIDQPIERIMYLNGTPRARRVFHADAIGSIAALTAPDPTPVQTYAYTAFGAIRRQTGPDPNRTTYTAREHLGDSQGWMYYRYRIYNQNIGRFVAEDPHGFVDGPNVWIYCRNHVMNWIDAVGLDVFLENTKAAFGLHQRVCISNDMFQIGQSFGLEGPGFSQICFSQGCSIDMPTPSGDGNGIVYEDSQEPTTMVVKHFKTTYEEDAWAVVELQSQLGWRAQYGFRNQCRCYSQRQYQKLVDEIRKRRTPSEGTSADEIIYW